MTVSNSTDFELDVADYVEEAFERCGLEARTGYDLKTAKRSLNLMQITPNLKVWPLPENGKKAFGISDRSGFRYRLKDMRKEWNGLLVGKDEYEEKHPQLEPFGTGQVGSVTVIVPASVTVSISGFAVLTPSVGSVTVATAGGVSVPVTGSSNTASAGSVTILIANVIAAVTGSAGTASAGSVTTVTNVTNYAVTVASGTNSYGSGNKYYINGSVSPTLTLNEGSTYWFDQSDSSNSSHPLRFSTTANGTWGGGSQYTTGVTTVGTPGSAGAYTKITVASGAPTLHYYCTNHSGMGGQANTP
eukprot:gene1734-1030_t